MNVDRSFSLGRIVFHAFLIIFLVFGAAGCGEQSFRSFWADAFSVGFKSMAQIEDMVTRAASGNYNAIFVEVMAYHDTGYGGHGAYWQSSILPMASDISGLADPLSEVVSMAHAANIEVHAWIVPYRVSTSWPPSGNSLLAAHPEWLMVPMADMGDGPSKIGSQYTLDPGSPDVQEYLVGIVRELVTNYEIDGVNLDYIRYLQTDAGYPAVTSYTGSSLARFKAHTGYSGTPAPSGVGSWNDFRRRTIDELVRRLRAEIPSITSNPRQPLRFTADLICFGDAPADFTGSDAYLLHQNWRHWMERGWLDAGIPMNYKREYSSSQAQWYRNWVDASLGWRYDRHMFSGQASYLNRKADSITQMQYALDVGVDGTTNFSYDGTADEDMDGVSEANWSWYDYVSTQLFTLPVFTPTMPWRIPSLAEEGTVWGRVVDAITGDPIEGATVQVGGLDINETDANGYYVATMIPAAQGGSVYYVVAAEPGYTEPTVTGALVLPGEVVRLDIPLCCDDLGS